VASLALPLTNREQQTLQREVPSSAKAYEYFLRGNRLSYDSKQWSIARDLYLQCVEEDPQYAPAWARLGRIHHVMGKYLPTGTEESLMDAEAAFRRALELNADLTMAHKLFAQLEVDLGRGHDAMARLIERAHTADPELLAGLVSACRYCGLLDASAAAHRRALDLDPKIRTGVAHTWFLQADHARVVTVKIAQFPYIVASRTLLEGNPAGSIAAVERVAQSDFRDPEGLFYLSRHLAHVNEVGRALDLFERVVAGGFFCFSGDGGRSVAAAAPQETGVHQAPAPRRDPPSEGAGRVRAARRRQGAGCAAGGLSRNGFPCRPTSMPA
jgi:tetratricopeptide (TPR) repeat protein